MNKNNIILELNNNETEAQRLGRMIKILRLSIGMKREDFAKLDEKDLMVKLVMNLLSLG